MLIVPDTEKAEIEVEGLLEHRILKLQRGVNGHCTAAWVTEQNPVEKEKEKGKGREGKGREERNYTFFATFPLKRQYYQVVAKIK